MLCKAESRDPAHCLAEGRKVTRCAQDLCVATRSLLFERRSSDLARRMCTPQDRQGAVDVLEGV